MVSGGDHRDRRAPSSSAALATTRSVLYHNVDDAAVRAEHEAIVDRDRDARPALPRHRRRRRAALRRRRELPRDHASCVATSSPSERPPRPERRRSVRCRDGRGVDFDRMTTVSISRCATYDPTRGRTRTDRRPLPARGDGGVRVSGPERAAQGQPALPGAARARGHHASRVRARGHPRRASRRRRGLGRRQPRRTEHRRAACARSGRTPASQRSAPRRTCRCCCSTTRALGSATMAAGSTAPSPSARRSSRPTC